MFLKYLAPLVCKDYIILHKSQECFLAKLTVDLLPRTKTWARRPNQSTLKEINPEYSLKGLMLKLQHSGHLMQRADSLEKTRAEKD